MWHLSQAYRCRPSDLVHLEDPLLRFWFDRGIRILGVYITNNADAAADNAGRGARGDNKAILENGARQRAIAKMLGEDLHSSSAGYRSYGSEDE